LYNTAESVKDHDTSSVAHLNVQAAAAHRDADVVKNLVMDRQALSIRKE
jgi:hypothetical protein